MVRLKNRYLLVSILYPGLDNRPVNSKLPDIVEFNQPTTNDLSPQALLKGLKAEVSNLFGDYGSGAIADSLTVKYLSPATSTFILRVTRPHYRIVWAALSMMSSVPVKNGKSCVFRVVRVSGTIRKAEEEAVRRARIMIVKARLDAGEQSHSTLDSIFGTGEDHAKADSTRDILRVDGSDSEEELSDGNG